MTDSTREPILNIVADTIPEFLAALVQVAKHFDQMSPWWRGHANANWKLQPSIYHRGMGSKEPFLAANFRNLGKVRHREVPHYDDKNSWLLLMQHYGLPTRLLDWSSSPLVALFFAVNDTNLEQEDAVVWGLCSTRLNENQIGEDIILGPDTKIASEIFYDAWRSRRTKKGEDKIVALHTQHIDIRQLVQSSQFTIHGIDLDMKELDHADRFLCSITIPSHRKANFRTLLQYFNIGESSLFPDLQNLAKQLVETQFVAE